MSNILILACIPFRIIGDTDTEEAILLFAVPGSWFLLMFFAGYVFYVYSICNEIYRNRFYLYFLSVRFV